MALEIKTVPQSAQQLRNNSFARKFNAEFKSEIAAQVEKGSDKPNSTYVGVQVQDSEGNEYFVNKSELFLAAEQSNCVLDIFDVVSFEPQGKTGAKAKLAVPGSELYAAKADAKYKLQRTPNGSLIASKL